MVQIVNISEARNKLSTLVKQVVRTKKSIIIVRDSTPSVIMIPYEEIPHDDDYKKLLLTIGGGWFSDKEHRDIREEIHKRTKKIL